MATRILHTLEYRNRRYSLILNYWDADPCDKCVFSKTCDAKFEDGQLDGYAPWEACGCTADHDSYFVKEGDEDK